MPDPKRERDRLRNRIRQLEQERDDLRRVVGWHDPAYIAVLVDLADIAIYAVRRPTDLGGPISTNHAESRPPIVLPAKADRAYDLLRKDRVLQRHRASELRAHYRRLVDGAHANDAPERRASGATLC